ncbi:FadR family transcriptional regulator, partial [Pseudomonas syringae]
MDYRRPSERKSMHARIVQDLGMQIVSGRFKPDETLPAEALLCEEYAVSRPVLREATRALAATGLVHPRPRVGTVVTARRDWHPLDPDVAHWVSQHAPPPARLHPPPRLRPVRRPPSA